MTDIDNTPVVDERYEASDAEIAATTETEGGWVHYAQLTLIIVKVLVVSALLLIALTKWRRKHGCGVVTYFLGLNVFIMVALLIQDLTIKLIPTFWFLCMAANYINFLGLMYLLRNLKTREGESLKARTKVYFIVMNCLYGLTLFAAFIPRFGPTCSSSRLYPPVMNWSCFLFVANCVYHMFQHYKYEYGLKWDTQLVGEDGDILYTKNMFMAQMKYYVCYQIAVSVVQICIQIIGRVAVHSGEGKILGCTAGGY